jgi:hypothetical protein
VAGFGAGTAIGYPESWYVWIGERSTGVSAEGLGQGLVDRGYQNGGNFILKERYAKGDSEKTFRPVGQSTSAPDTPRKQSGHAFQQQRCRRQLNEPELAGPSR